MASTYLLGHYERSSRDQFFLLHKLHSEDKISSSIIINIRIKCVEAVHIIIFAYKIVCVKFFQIVLIYNPGTDRTM